MVILSFRSFSSIYSLALTILTVLSLSLKYLFLYLKLLYKVYLAMSFSLWAHRTIFGFTTLYKCHSLFFRILITKICSELPTTILFLNSWIQDPVIQQFPTWPSLILKYGLFSRFITTFQSFLLVCHNLIPSETP